MKHVEEHVEHVSHVPYSISLPSINIQRPLTSLLEKETTAAELLDEMGKKASACSLECRCMELGDGVEGLSRAVLI